MRSHLGVGQWKGRKLFPLVNSTLKATLRPACVCYVDAAFITSTISSEGGALPKRAAAWGAPEEGSANTLCGLCQALLPL